MLRIDRLARLVLILAGTSWTLQTGAVAAMEAARPALPVPGAQTSPSNASVPALPGTKTAADTFRELLAMDPAARAQALASYAEPRRNYLQDRLREYESLPADEREMRLKQLELNCHLPDLMKIAPANRAKRLAAVPADIRPLVEKKLQEWDLLPPDVQRDVLEHQTTATYFLRVRPGSAAQPQPVSMSTLPPLPGAEGASSDPEKLERFFKLPAREQEKTLDVLPAREREDMERTLQAFAKLPLTQRQTCIDSFVKFRRLSKEQRDQFLKNAERWKAMSPAERETWRTLVKILPPGAVSTNMPPLPHPQDGFGPGTTASNAGSSLPGQ